jgi:hypothetical protein
MKINFLIPAFLSLAGLSLIFILTAAPSVRGEADISDWPKASQKAIEHMKKTYGDPAEATGSMMIWYNTGPWKRTIVYREEFNHNFPMPHTDVIEQVIDYKVPAEKFSALAGYDGSVVCNRTNGEISARCDKEGANFLALNLANDIINGKMNVTEARDFYAQSIMKSKKGEQPEYMQKLQFTIAKGKTVDPDEASPVFDNTKGKAVDK